MVTSNPNDSIFELSNLSHLNPTGPNELAGDYLEEQNMLMHNIGIASKKQDIWSFQKVQELTKDTYVYHFKSDTHQVKNWMKGTRWIGRHFTL